MGIFRIYEQGGIGTVIIDMIITMDITVTILCHNNRVDLLSQHYGVIIDLSLHFSTPSNFIHLQLLPPEGAFDFYIRRTWGGYFSGGIVEEKFWEVSEQYCHWKSNVLIYCFKILVHM